MKLKKIICVLLAVLLMIPAFSASAEEVTDYVADYDTETPVIIVHGMSQNNTYLLDEDGEWIPDDTGYVTAWPLEFDISALIKLALPELIESIITRQDKGLSQVMHDAPAQALYVIPKDSEGNYINDVEVPCYEYPMSELPEEVKAEYYSFLPIQELGEIVGEDNVYYFGYDSIGDVVSETEKLHDYIHNVVLPQTGASQVKLCHISLGGTIAVNYLETYPEDYELIKKMVFVVPAIDGSDIIGDLITNNLSFYDSELLYNDILPDLLGDTYLAYILNMVLRLLPEDVLKSALSGLATGLVETAILPSSILWALCPTEYYEEGREMWLTDPEYASIAEKADYFMNARANFADNLAALQATGCEVFNVSCYGVNLFPICAEYKTKNGDKVIHSASTSMGATFADIGTTLGDNYTAAGTYCSDPTHNHLSPDGVVDATTGLLPCTTWYISGQAHELLPQNDVVLKLAIRAMADDNMKDVYSNPAYPQFNEGRLSQDARTNLALWEETDKSNISQAKIDAVDEAAEKVNELLDETIVDADEWDKADEALTKALVNAGVIEDDSPGFFEQILTKITKKMNEIVNKNFA